MKNKNVDRGGVIPYIIEDDQVKMLFMVPSDAKYGGTAWQIAKGKIENGESIEEGSFREAQEELGLFLPNIVERHDLGVFGSVHVYVAEIKDKEMFGEPHFETGDTKWLTPEEFATEGRDWQRPVIKAAERLINKKANS